jgi:hypothetical protein
VRKRLKDSLHLVRGEEEIREEKAASYSTHNINKREKKTRIFRFVGKTNIAKKGSEFADRPCANCYA